MGIEGPYSIEHQDNEQVRLGVMYYRWSDIKVFGKQYGVRKSKFDVHQHKVRTREG